MKKVLEKWKRTEIRGEHTEEPRYSMMVSVLHREDADALRMACRMNREMAGCNRFTLTEAEAFSQVRSVEQDRRKGDIPRLGGAQQEWDFE